MISDHCTIHVYTRLSALFGLQLLVDGHFIHLKTTVHPPTPSWKTTTINSQLNNHRVVLHITQDIVDMMVHTHVLDTCIASPY